MEEIMSVTIYSTPSCGYCHKAKDYFRSNNVPFTEYNVAADVKKAEEMVRKSGQMGVPVIDIKGKIIVGFNVPEIEKALKS
jgi:glutaredoxin-like YruB-family protein